MSRAQTRPPARATSSILCDPVKSSCASLVIAIYHNVEYLIRRQAVSIGKNGLFHACPGRPEERVIVGRRGGCAELRGPHGEDCRQQRDQRHRRHCLTSYKKDGQPTTRLLATALFRGNRSTHAREKKR